MWRFSAMIDLTNYDCFRVKERPDQTKYELLSILRTENCDLKLLRTKLWEKFGVPTDRCIFYFDEDEDQVPINLECEFEEALELTRQAVTVDTIILLIVGNFSANNLHLKMSSNEHKCRTEICKELNASLLHYWYSSSPPSWFTTYMESMKKDIVTAITSQVQKDMTEVLNKRLDMLALSKEHSSIVNEENQKKTKSPDDEWSNASVKHEPVNANTEDDSQARATSTFSQVAKKMAKRMAKNNVKTQQQMYDELIQLEKAIYKNRKEEKKMVHEHRLLSQVIIDNLDSDPNKSGQVNLPPESIDKKDFSNTMNTLKTENELRSMSCSVTGHQMMLDESRSGKDVSRCDDRTMSGEEKEKDDESFEIIQIPDSGNPDELIIQPEEPRRDSSRDSPSFELLSETSSTRVSPPCSVYMNEDHFSTYEEEHLCTPACNLRHLLDFHECLFGRRFNPHFSYSMMALKLYSTMTCPPKLIQKLEKWKGHSSKCPIDRFVNDEACNDTDEKDSQASYPSVCGSETQSRCSVQSHPSNDVTQSFHSHTTSITDTTVNVEPWNALGYGRAHRMEHPTDNEDVRAASMPTRDNPNVPPCGMCWRCLLTVTAPYTCDDKECVDCNVTLPEILEKYFSNNVIPCASHNDTAQSGSDRPSDSSEQSKTTLTNERITELSTADPVHILPETLVTAAAQVGCFAYDTAREMFDKLRAHTKEESAKRRDGTKCDSRKPRIRTDSVKHRDGAKCVDKKSFGHL